MKKNYLLILLSAVFILASCGKKTTEETQSDSNTKEKTLQHIEIKELDMNAVSLFADNWFVVTAGDENSFNPMTISWGALGYIWETPSATIYIRNTRHTYPFIENSKYFTLCAFPEEYREQVLFIGSNSGRDMDKVAATGLTPKTTDLGNVYYDEAHLVIECEKIYYNDIDPANLSEPKGQAMYEKEKAMHRMYIGKIVNAWQKK